MNQSKPRPTVVAGKPASTAPRDSGCPAPRPSAPTRSTTGASPKPESSRVASERTQPGQSQAQGKTGKVVHDSRGNAVWDWLKQTGRNAIESTTRMLRKLETPELKVEDAHEEELRIQPESGESGGGYDPYNQPIKSRRTPIK